MNKSIQKLVISNWKVPIALLEMPSIQLLKASPVDILMMKEFEFAVVEMTTCSLKGTSQGNKKRKWKKEKRKYVI